MQCFLLISVLLVCLACAFVPGSNSPTFTRPALDTRRYNLFDTLGSIANNFGKKVTASHILIGPKTMDGPEAQAKLLELKADIGGDPEKFAEAAAATSTCPSAKKGGSLGSFGPGMMVKQFDKICFEEEVGVVHGPISTQFGEHLIFINKRTGDK